MDQQLVLRQIHLVIGPFNTINLFIMIFNGHQPPVSQVIDQRTVKSRGKLSQVFSDAARPEVIEEIVKGKIKSNMKIFM